MLDRLHIQNYKCLRDVTVDLGKLTILIGPNDSGKSSFLEVVRTLGKIAREHFHNIFVGDKVLQNLVWRKDVRQNIIWEVRGTRSGNQFCYHVEIPINDRLVLEWLEFGGKEIFREQRSQGVTRLAQISEGELVRAALDSSIEFHFDPEKMAEPSVPQANASLSASGDNLAGFLDGLQNEPVRSAFDALERDLHLAIPTLQGIRLPPAPNPPGAKYIQYALASASPKGRPKGSPDNGSEPMTIAANGSEPVTIPASLASGGALLLTAFLALAYSKTPDVLLIEEPENGLHPSRLQLVVDVLRKMTTGELGGRARQIIVTTHNPLLLNFAKPEEVRVFVSDAEKGTQVKSMASIPNADRLLKEFALGELWYLLGEERLFEAQPA